MREQLNNYSGNYPIIINLDDMDGPGTHWTVLNYNDNNNSWDYFDSYGMMPPKEFNNDGKTLYYNNERLQGDNNLCGYYCIYYIEKNKNGYSMDDIITDFIPHGYNINDNIVIDYLK